MKINKKSAGFVLALIALISVMSLSLTFMTSAEIGVGMNVPGDMAAGYGARSALPDNAVYNSNTSAPGYSNAYYNNNNMNYPAGMTADAYRYNTNTNMTENYNAAGTYRNNVTNVAPNTAGTYRNNRAYGTAPATPNVAGGTYRNNANTAGTASVTPNAADRMYRNNVTNAAPNNAGGTRGNVTRTAPNTARGRAYDVPRNQTAPNRQNATRAQRNYAAPYDASYRNDIVNDNYGGNYNATGAYRTNNMTPDYYGENYANPNASGARTSYRNDMTPDTYRNYPADRQNTTGSYRNNTVTDRNRTGAATRDYRNTTPATRTNRTDTTAPTTTAAPATKRTAPATRRAAPATRVAPTTRAARTYRYRDEAVAATNNLTAFILIAIAAVILIGIIVYALTRPRHVDNTDGRRR